jgi:hypothetical protein
MPQLEVIGLWLIGIGAAVAMVGLTIQTPRGIDGIKMNIASRRGRAGYAASAGGAMWSAVGGLFVTAERTVPTWGGWIALTLFVIAVTAWLAGAAVYHRDERKLLDEAKAASEPDRDRITACTEQADWRSALRWPFGHFG